MSESGFSQTFLDYLGRGELRYARDPHTGQALGYTARPGQDHPVEWLPASGRASLHTFAIYRQGYNPDFPVPYNVAMVQLDEGPLLLSTVRVGDLSRLKVGMRLVANIDEHGKLVFLPA